MNRTYNTLFMLMSVDGKISTGIGIERDFDKDLKSIDGIKEGLSQYYDLERKTDRHSLNSGFVMAKIGVNSDNSPIKALDVSFIIIDNFNLNVKGVTNLCNGLKTLYLVTKNKNHPAFKLSISNLEIIFYEDEIDFNDLFEKLHTKYNIERITIQSGGTLNSVFFKNKLIDEISLVMAPTIITGKDTPTLVDGESLVSDEELKYINALELIEINKLDNSYLHLKYKIS